MLCLLVRSFCHHSRDHSYQLHIQGNLAEFVRRQTARTNEATSSLPSPALPCFSLKDITSWKHTYYMSAYLYNLLSFCLCQNGCFHFSWHRLTREEFLEIWMTLQDWQGAAAIVSWMRRVTANQRAEQGWCMLSAGIGRQIASGNHAALKEPWAGEAVYRIYQQAIACRHEELCIDG